MKILLYSPAFHPRVGGLEALAEMLATGFHERGHEVIVVSTTPAGRPGGFSFRVVRSPGPVELLRLTRWCDVFFQANLSLKGVWPLLLVRRPLVVSHNSWYRQAGGEITWRDRLKRRVLGHAAASVSASRALADDLDTPSVVIENPYRDDLFRRLPGERKEEDLLFVGRLVSDKGVDLLVEALALLRDQGQQAGLTIVGEGPEEEPLRLQVERADLTDRVRFAGVLRGEALVTALNRHRILVVPSRYNEPFGIVALEGLACGCLVIGTEGGGLKDAVGPGGWTVANADATALAGILGPALRGELAPREPEAVEAHLAEHSRARVVERYLEVLEHAAGRLRGRAGTQTPSSP